MKNQCFWNTLFAIFIASGISCVTFVIQNNLNQKKEYINKDYSNSQHQDLCKSTDIDTEVSNTSGRVSKIILLKNKFKDLYEGGDFEKNHSPKENKATPPYTVGYGAKHGQTIANNERRDYVASRPPKRLNSQGHDDDENQSGVVSKPKPKSKANPKAKPNPKPKLKAKPKAKPNPKPKLNLKPKLKAKPKAKPKPKTELKAKPKNHLLSTENKQ
jgi:hypothetical protein